MRRGQWRQGIITGILLFIALWLASLIYGLAGKTVVAVSEARRVRAQYEKLEERKRVLETNLAALGTERGRDAAIRTAFGVARSGEAVIVVVPPAEPEATSTPSWWKRLTSWF